jgi:hypothetical protein
MPKSTKATKKTDEKKAWLKKEKPSVYKIETKNPNKTILIVTEGQQEELYFKSFPVITLTVVPYNLQGQSKLKLIKETEKYIANSDMKFDEVWCVFDMDVKQGEKEFADFDNAIESGKNKGYKVAYSNDCFDLWFYLHYHFTNQKNHRSFYYKQLGDIWGCNYVEEGKKFNFCRNTYSRLENDTTASQENAIKSAKKLYDEQKHLDYHDQNPVTLVFELVELLNEYRRK